MSVAAAPPDLCSVEDKRGGCTSRPPFRLRISAAAALPDPLFRLRISVAAALLDPRLSLRTSGAAALLDPLSGYRINVAAGRRYFLAPL